MTSPRKLKYSVARNYSLRMYKDETNGTYRKLDDDRVDENYLRELRVKARNRPLSYTLGSYSFREADLRDPEYRGHSLQHLKKARSRYSWNLPQSYSLDLDFRNDVNATKFQQKEPITDVSENDGIFATSKKQEISAFDYVPETDIIPLPDSDSVYPYVAGDDDKTLDVVQSTSTPRNLKLPLQYTSEGTPLCSPVSAGDSGIEHYSNSQNSDSSNNSSRSSSNNSDSKSSSRKSSTSSNKNLNGEIIVTGHPITENSKNLERKQDKSTDANETDSYGYQAADTLQHAANQDEPDSERHAIVKRRSFKETFPKDVLLEFQDKKEATKDRPYSYNKGSLENIVHGIFDSDEHFKQSKVTPDSSSITISPSAHSIKSDISCPPLPATLPPDSIDSRSIGSLIDVETISNSSDISDAPSACETDDLEHELNILRSEVEAKLNMESIEPTGNHNQKTSIAYYGPVYAKDNTLILPTHIEPPAHFRQRSISTGSNSSNESSQTDGKKGVDQKEKALSTSEESGQEDNIVDIKHGNQENKKITTVTTEYGHVFDSKQMSEDRVQNTIENITGNQLAPKSLEDSLTSNSTNGQHSESRSDSDSSTNSTSRSRDTSTMPSPQPSRNIACVNADIHQADVNLNKAITTSVNNEEDAQSSRERHRGHFVVVAIDFGTTYSGYAFSFTRDPDNIYMMRKWEGGDPGVINQKTPTTVLLTPDGEFHSFGYSARDHYHDIDKDEVQNWLYFEKFKMALHHAEELSKDTLIKASNGRLFPAMTVFSHALRFFQQHALQELSDQSEMKIINEDVRWVISVPAIWKASAKQFMRQAAYEAGLISPEYPDQLLIALEPEVASIYCRKLRMHQLIPDAPIIRPLQSPKKASPEPMNMDPACQNITKGSRYMVVDCGGGTVDITVHELGDDGKLRELHRATGGPYGSVGVDIEFEHLLEKIFGKDFIGQYKLKRPSGWIDLMIAFESRKRSASPYKSSCLNISLPFSFIDYYRKHKRIGNIEGAIKKYGNKDIQWSAQGMLRLTQTEMHRLFLPTMDKITQTIGDILNSPETKGIKHLFLVGGFAESPLLQSEIRKEFGKLLKIIIPQGVGMTILKGAVMFGLDPGIVSVRKSRQSYGVGVLNKFNPDRHPVDKKVCKDEREWCKDIFDKYVTTNQPIALGDVVLRSYTPVTKGQKISQINIYGSDNPESMFVTDIGVRRCGTLLLNLSDEQENLPQIREIQTRMLFGETEIKVSALDVATGNTVEAIIDFLNT